MAWRTVDDLAVVVDGAVRQPKGARPASVFALLLIRRNRAVSVDSLIDALWPDDPPATARNSIQRFVSDIRTVLGPARDRLITEPQGYRIEVRDGELDLAQLEAEIQLERGDTSHSPAERFDRLKRLVGRLDADLFQV